MKKTSARWASRWPRPFLQHTIKKGAMPPFRFYLGSYDLLIQYYLLIQIVRVGHHHDEYVFPWTKQLLRITIRATGTPVTT